MGATQSSDAKVVKRAVNLRVDSQLLDEAKALDINLSATLESALAITLKAQREAKWLEENREAIAAYNEYFTKNGCFSDSFRAF
jgi:antitoxin CcdA